MAIFRRAMRIEGVAVVWCMAQVLSAQQAEVTRYDVGQGLPRSMVNHVLQDADGFIWFGTGDGLARFDGQRSVVYKHDVRDPASLRHNSIWGLAQRADGRLWVGTRTGLDLLDRRTGRFTHVVTGPSSDGCWQPLWCVADSALFYSPLTSTLLTVRGDHMSTWPVGHIASYAMHADPRSGTVTQALYGDTLLTLTRASVVNVAMLPSQGGELTMAIWPLGDRWLVLTDRGGYTWSSTEGRGALPLGTSDLFTRVRGPKRICSDKHGNLWVGLSGTGVVQLDAAMNLLAQYPLVPSEERPLTITTMLADRQGNIWVGTDGKGVFRIAPQRIAPLIGDAVPRCPGGWGR